jgi:threonylcarbamoyladenosine tRNA methylthiotransferase MtaB
VPVLIHTLGCKLNQLESESYADAFAQAGLQVLQHELAVSQTETPPSVVVINTCTVTSKADQKARRIIRKALTDYPNATVIVTGCYAQLDKEEIEKLENDGRQRLLVLGKEKLLGLPDIFKGSGEQGKDKREKIKEKRENVFQFAPEKFSFHTRSFLKIQDGCNNKCTYCRIRLARGLSVSLDAGFALSRLKILETDHAEAVITGVNICQYEDQSGCLSRRSDDETDGSKLGGLLRYLLSGTEKIALRLSSLSPDFITEDFAKILSDKRIRPHFHLSIQSGSKKILERMGRGYDGKTIEKAVSLLRGAKSDPFLACDIITGFPGETQTEFEKTYELCRKTGFAWIHVFPYSKRRGTAAWSFKDSVQEKEKKMRVQLLTDLAWQGRADYIQRWLNREVDVLIEKSPPAKPHLRAISENYLKLLVTRKGKEAPLPGTVLRCKIIKAGEERGEYDAIAEAD